MDWLCYLASCDATRTRRTRTGKPKLCAGAEATLFFFFLSFWPPECMAVA